MKPRPFDYVRPETIDEALAVLAEHGEDARVMAGGQSLMAMLNLRLAEPKVIIDIGGHKEPLYVVRIDPEARRLVVGPRRALAVGAAIVEGVNWIGEQQRDLAAKVRSLAQPVAVHWDGTRIDFATPEYGVAPGQSAVFYDGERLLGGGTIAATEAVVSDEAAAAA